MKISETRIHIHLCNEHKHLVPIGVRADDAEKDYFYGKDIRCDFFDDSDEPGCSDYATAKILVTIPMEAEDAE